MATDLKVNPQRLMLGQNYRNAIRVLTSIQQEFLELSKNMKSLGSKEVVVKEFIASLKILTTKIAKVLNSKDNDQLTSKGLLFKLVNEIASNYLVPGSKNYLERLRGVTDEVVISRFQTNLKQNIDKAYSFIELGTKDKFRFSNLFKSQTAMQGLGTAGQFLANLTPFGSILTAAGGTAYNLLEEYRGRKWENQAPKLGRNLSAAYGGSTGGSGSSRGSSALSGLGGLTGGMGAGLAGSSLFEFFNQDAYKARWTRELLDTVKKIAGSTSNTFSTLIPNLLKLLPVVAGVVGIGMGLWDAYKGWGKAGKWFGTDKPNLGQKASSAAGGFLGGTGPGLGEKGSTWDGVIKNALWGMLKGAFIGASVGGPAAIPAAVIGAVTGLVTHLIGGERIAKAIYAVGEAIGKAFGFLGGIIHQAWSWFGGLGGKGTGKNYRLHGPSGVTTETIASKVRNARGTIPATPLTSKAIEQQMLVALDKLLEETKKGNTRGASNSGYRQRVIHNDIGDMVTQLVAKGDVSQPRG